MIIVFQKVIMTLGCQILYRSIIASIIGMAILGIRKLALKKISPKCIYIIWIVFMIALIFPISLPNKISIYNYIKVDNVKVMENSNKNNILNIANDNNFENNATDFTSLKKNIITPIDSNFETYVKITLVVIWFTIALIKLLKFFISYFLFSKQIGNEEVTDKRILAILEKCKESLKIKRNIKIIKQNVQTVPSIMGIKNVRVLFTDTILKFDDVHIEYILMHELSHFKRKDHIQNMMISILKSIYWFNPIITTMFKYIKEDIELATDENAVSEMNKNERKRYCRAIVEISVMCSRGLENLEEVLALTSGKETLEQRIDMIFTKEKFEEHFVQINLITIAIIMIIWILLYPTSYAKTYEGNLRLALKNGSYDCILLPDNDTETIIRTKCGEEIKMIIENRNYKNIFYNIRKLNDIQSESEIFGIATDNIVLDEIGEYICEFCIVSQDNSSAECKVKIIVE